MLTLRIIKRIDKRIDRFEESLKWIGLMLFTGHLPSLPIPKLISDVLEEYKHQHPDERIWP